MSAYPNPFDKSTTVCFYGAVNSHENARIEIYNIKGKKIRTLENLECINRVNAKTTRSFYSISWNGRDDKNRPVTSGIYFYKLMVGEKEIASSKMLLLK
ncbi:MAG: T9SS type A sorting domain-containing protein, partial [Candidatus Celaenobacter polaris]|nr:T9SS type A sorting domain-containing protein [Candidatus Celaenobacter polaris]